MPLPGIGTIVRVHTGSGWDICGLVTATSDTVTAAELTSYSLSAAPSDSVFVSGLTPAGDTFGVWATEGTGSSQFSRLATDQASSEDTSP